MYVDVRCYRLQLQEVIGLDSRYDWTSQQQCSLAATSQLWTLGSIGLQEAKQIDAMVAASNDRDEMGCYSPCMATLAPSDHHSLRLLRLDECAH